MLKEEYLQELLAAIYEKGSLDVYDFTAALFTVQSEEFRHTKSWADQLVRDKLALYSDTGHTMMELTNFGKYWILNGGYVNFLKEGHNTKDVHKEKIRNKEKEELVEARLRLTHYRLVGFWLTLVISSIGFILSLYNLYLIMQGRK